MLPVPFYSHNSHMVFVHLEWNLLTVRGICHHYMCPERGNLLSHNVNVATRVQVTKPIQAHTRIYVPIYVNLVSSCSL